MTTSDQSISGWGYEGRTVDDLIEHARGLGVGLIVDVRLNAISRKRGFSKRGLEEKLTDAGLRYLHLPALGNPRDNRDAFAAPAESPAAVAARGRFAEEVLASESGQSALRVLAGAALRGPVLLLCYENDESCCHRAPVLNAVRDLVSEALLTA